MSANIHMSQMSVQTPKKCYFSVFILTFYNSFKNLPKKSNLLYNLISKQPVSIKPVKGSPRE